MRKEIIKSKGIDGKKYVTLPLDEWNGLKETLYLLSNPNNAKELLESIAELNAGRGIERELIEVKQ